MVDRYLNWDKLNIINNKIDWKSNVGFTLLFFINNEKHSLKIIEDCGYRGRSHYIKVKFDNGTVKELRANRLQSMEFKKIYYKYTFRYKPGDVVNGVYIIEQIAKKRKSDNWVAKYYKCKCTKDGYEYEVSEYSLHSRKFGCPVCSNKKIVSGINDVATTHPWMVEYFKDKDEAKKYSAKSGHVITCICPTCGHERDMQIEVLHRYGFRCNYCSDKISYPNKLVTYALLQLEENGIICNFCREYGADWAKNYKYDCYFECGDHKYIIEMDGGFHYQDNTYNHMDVSVQQDIDNEKSELATLNNVNMIRIDCHYRTMDERFDYISNNLKRKLSQICDISCIDWTKCSQNASNNLLHEICSKYDSGINRIILCEMYPWISNTTIGNYLYIGSKCGFCQYHGEYSKKYSAFYLYNSNLDMLEKVQTYSQLNEILKSKYSININRTTFYRHINSSGILENKYYLKADIKAPLEV